MSNVCELCNKELQVGDWPHCPHESTRPEYAQRFRPIIYFKSPDGRLQFPMASDSPIPPGYERVEITTTREAARFEREMNQRERADYEQHKHREREAANEFWREQNAELKRRAAHFSPEGRHAVDYLLQQHAEQDRLPKSYDPGFHIDIMHNDRSNRMPHDDARTGWRDRRE